ncbi:asparagine synthase (glutamine-hydrolyzing) [Lentzea sp. BCCO 10_0061]|uniref:asparagine synthase (glutamine-hydrolyzing) n=1 Tax=Lentzea sokolovensis TaxID=3095429 RepID=A0ABU4UPH2_9PSEU|nr:asparagine synthase (glutamine-hydrolyzing) [Lentzea sp. BCCO 10_0061]MDX8141374.1 asparagine synthase (glutamine-hydrolyzing) [Lentzea sp. BCCO 10_0061]
MCGIAGWVSFDSDVRTAEETAEAMTATMSRRGPDDSGLWLRKEVALGHHRLAVVDPEGGAQPMNVRTAAGDVCLVYSGEIYNTAELRRRLSGLGHVWRTQCDTEVVLHGYLQWGDAVVDHLNGMFAFAIWDERTRSLLLARDRLGIKPLYYYPTRDGVLFGSEPQAILANPLAQRVVDADGLRELFAYTKQPGWALWKGMRELLPGEIARVSPAGLTTRTYWKLSAAPHTDDRLTTVDRVRDLLSDVVRRQMVADVPQCMLLSGGLDSGVLVGLAARETDRVNTFSVDFVGQEENFEDDGVRGTPDAPYIRDMADLVGADHRGVLLSPADVSDPVIRRALLTARGIPQGQGDMDTSLYRLFQAVREEFTVALSGEAADEVFGGYRWMHDEQTVNSGTFPWLAFRNPIMSGGDAHLTRELRAELDVATYVADQYRTAVAAVEHLDDETEAEAKMRTVGHLHLTRFLQLLLDRKDRASMAVGLEVRVPFCDHRLVEYLYNTPWALKTFDGREKSILRRAGRHVLPASVRDRVKSPYPSTQDSAYVVAVHQQAREVLAQRDSRLFAVVEEAWLRDVCARDPLHLDVLGRMALERVLDLYHWIDLYSPTIDVG